MSGHDRWRWQWVLLATIAVLAVVLLVGRARAPSPHRASGVVPADSSPAAPLAGEFEASAAAASGPVPAGPLAATTAHLRIAARSGSYTQVQAAALAEPLEAALQYLQDRTAMQLAAPVAVVFDHHPGVCGLDGAADTTNRTIYLFTCAATPAQRAVNILAHEFVHQLAHDHYGPSHLQADLMLSEGLATWGAGTYWLGREPDFQHFVAHNYRTGLLPLESDYTVAPVPDAMNRLYYEWAAFVEWTLATQGRPAFDRLYRAGTAHRLGSAPYDAVFGTDFASIEAAWRQWLDR